MIAEFLYTGKTSTGAPTRSCDNLSTSLSFRGRSNTATASQPDAVNS
eukprot:CAMPEP_0178456622 /NCGR_PEP_ID=MMETSP0689_2-20121128/46577_1 /TAXON_ID=160604 /ORGANISM="Amphidinium massartii, Strain CS-259" /LENGTH=46 /DNA_ID= /DNA_START= /DNA_END= /DNA_ORIENTATION=